MTKFLEFFKPRKENALLKKLKNTLRAQKVIQKLTKAVFIGGLPVSDTILEDMVELVEKSEKETFLKRLGYNVAKDNFEFYYVEDTTEKAFIAILIDPVELYSPERLVKICPVERLIWNGVEGLQIL
jgi:hypothetical protein